MPASPEQKARRERDKIAALTLRRSGLSASEAGEAMGRSARSIRELCQGESTEPALVEPKSAAAAAAKAKATRAARTKNLPRNKRGQPEGGRVLRPILLYDGPGGGFGIPGETVSAAGLGPSIPVDGWGDPMGDGRSLRKMGESIVDLGTTEQADKRRYDSGRNDESWDDLEVPPDARRMVVVREDGSRTEFDLADL